MCPGGGKACSRQKEWREQGAGSLSCDQGFMSPGSVQHVVCRIE